MLLVCAVHLIYWVCTVRQVLLLCTVHQCVLVYTVHQVLIGVYAASSCYCCVQCITFFLLGTVHQVFVGVYSASSFFWCAQCSTRTMKHVQCAKLTFLHTSLCLRRDSDPLDKKLHPYYHWTWLTLMADLRLFLRWIWAQFHHKQQLCCFMRVFYGVYSAAVLLMIHVEGSNKTRFRRVSAVA